MSKGTTRSPLGFEGVVRLIKAVAAEAASAGRQPVSNSHVLAKLRLLINRVTDLVDAHPFHAPVLAHQLARATTHLATEGPHRCVTCGGTCDDIHAKVIEAAARALPYLAPKGVTQLQAVYAACRNPDARGVTVDIALRSAAAIFWTVRRRCKDSDALDVEVSKLLKQIPIERDLRQQRPLNVASAAGDPYRLFLGLAQGGTLQSVEEGSLSWEEANVHDICAAVTPDMGHSPARALLMYLASQYLETTNLAKIDENDIKGTCRILHCLHRAGIRRAATKAVAAGMCQIHGQRINARDVSCLLPIVDLADTSTGGMLLHRMESILRGGDGDSGTLGIQAAAAWIGQLARMPEDTQDERCLALIERCTQRIIGVIQLRPACLSQKANFSATLVSLRALQSQRRSNTAQYCFNQLLQECLSRQMHWIGLSVPYDMNELLRLIIEERFPNGCIAPERQKDDTMGAERSQPVTEHAAESALRALIKRLKAIYQPLMERCSQGHDLQRTPFVRDLCMFTGMYEKYQLDAIDTTDDSFDVTITQLLLDRYRDMKLIDAADIALYLHGRQTDRSRFEHVVAHIAALAPDDASLSRREMRRIQQLAMLDETAGRQKHGSNGR